MSSIEAILKDEMSSGKTYESADDFYNRRIKGHSYIVTDKDDSEEEIAALRQKFADWDRRELDRLQIAYADKWAA